MINNKTNPKRQKCEVFARVVGYMRPISQFNAGKQSEVSDRVMFDNSVIKKF